MIQPHIIARNVSSLSKDAPERTRSVGMVIRNRNVLLASHELNMRSGLCDSFES